METTIVYFVRERQRQRSISRLGRRLLDEVTKDLNTNPTDSSLSLSTIMLPKDQDVPFAENESDARLPCTRRTLLGTSNREPQEYSRKTLIEYKDPGRYIPTILGFPVMSLQCKGLNEVRIKAKKG